MKEEPGGEAGDEEEEEEVQGIYFDLGAETQEQSSGGSVWGGLLSIFSTY